MSAEQIMVISITDLKAKLSGQPQNGQQKRPNNSDAGGNHDDDPPPSALRLAA